ncbi:MAG: RidA family protein [Chloroflexi bacterium]|nr:RidA family protein [Chloroflexota bacterium]
MDRQLISARTPWGDLFGYSRAVRIGNVVKVGGTIATDKEGNVHGKDDIYRQAVYIIRKIESALEEAGASLGDVVRTRMFVTDINNYEGLARAHAEFFGEIHPASTMVEISRLMSEDFLLEMEAEAIIETDAHSIKDSA